MQLSTKATLWHFGSMGAGALAMLTVMSSHQVDVYAIIDALGKTYRDIVTLAGLVAPVIAAGAAAYRNYNMTRVEKDNQAATTQPLGKIGSLILIGMLVLMASPSLAQPRLSLTDIAKRNDANAPGRTVAPSFGGVDQLGFKSPDEFLGSIEKMNLADFKYAKALAKARGNKMTLACWSAWVDLLSSTEAPLNDDAGAPLSQPDPHIFTTIERASELLQALQPGGDIQVGCGAMADALKKSVFQLAGMILGGASATAIMPIP